MVLCPMCQCVKVVTDPKPSITWPFIFDALVDQSAVRMTQNLLSQDIGAVHGVIVSCIRYREFGVEMQFDDQ